jgi:hypothetical protein
MGDERYYMTGKFSNLIKPYIHIGFCSAGLLYVAQVHAVSTTTYGFNLVTANPGFQTGLTVDVIDLGSGAVGFNFNNNSSPLVSSITTILFENVAAGIDEVKKQGTVVTPAIPPVTPPITFNSLSGVGVAGGGGVHYTRNGSPDQNHPFGLESVIPAWKGASFEFDPNNPSGFQQNGIDNGESLHLTFSLNSPAAYADLIGELDAKTWRIAFHLQSIGGSGPSDAYILGNQIPPPSDPPTGNPVPDNGRAMVLMTLGCFGITWMRRLVSSR